MGGSHIRHLDGDKLASHYADVISINLSGAASGTFEAARAAAGRTDAPGRVHVINTLNASLGEGLLVIFAAECADAGLSAEKTLAAVNALIPETVTYALVQDLSYVVRGGRLPKWVKIIAELLHLTPILRITPDGRIALSSFFFGKRDRIAKFARHAARSIKSGNRLNVAIGHAVSPDDLTSLEHQLRQEIPGIERLATAELGTALGVHGGPGTLIIATQPSLRPADLID